MSRPASLGADSRLPFRDRSESGEVLADALSKYRGRDDLLVLGLPRGGVPVASAVACSLGAQLDVFVVRKLGVPGHEELAMGAIATGGGIVVNESVLHSMGIGEEAFNKVVEGERRELERRERLYRGHRPSPRIEGRVVILVDDGLATGATMRAAAEAVRLQRPGRIVVAVPVGATDTCAALAEVADEVVCVSTPRPFMAVGLWYRNFDQTTDEEVRRELDRANGRVACRKAPDETDA